jgi:hypothetical protein
MDLAMKQMRIVWRVMLATALAVVLLTEMLKPAEKPVKSVIFAAIAFLTACMFIGTLKLSRSLIRKAEERLQITSGHVAAINKLSGVPGRSWRKQSEKRLSFTE